MPALKKKNNKNYGLQRVILAKTAKKFLKRQYETLFCKELIQI